MTIIYNKPQQKKERPLESYFQLHISGVHIIITSYASNLHSYVKQLTGLLELCQIHIQI